MALEHLPERRDTIEQAIDLRLDLRYPLSLLGELGRMLDCLHEAETLAARLDDPRRLGVVSSYMAYYFWVTGDLDHALAAGQRALMTAHRLGDVALQVRAHRVLGYVYHAAGDYHRALELFRQTQGSLEGDWVHVHFSPTGLPAFSVTAADAWLLWCLAELGAFTEGFARGEDMVRVAEGVDAPHDLVVVAYFGMGFLSLRQGDLQHALALLERGREYCQCGKLPIWFPLLTATLGYAYALSGRVAEALPLLETAVELDASMGIMGGHALLLTWLSEAQLRAGRTDDAIQLVGRALVLARAHQERSNQAYALRLLGNIAAHRDPLDTASAETHYRQAMALAEELGMRPLQAHCHHGLGMLYAKTGQAKQAHAALSAAIDLYRAMAMRFWLPQAEAALAQVDAQ